MKASDVLSRAAHETAIKTWADPANRPLNEVGSKIRVGPQASTYSDWRRTVGRGCYANDIDWVEWRVSNDGATRVVALIETTFYEDKPELRPCLPQYCTAALARFLRDGQSSVVQLIAASLGVRVYFVVARRDLEVFFVCRLLDLEVFFVCRLLDQKWRQMDEPTYRRWICGLGTEAQLKGIYADQETR